MPMQTRKAKKPTDFFKGLYEISCKFDYVINIFAFLFSKALIFILLRVKMSSKQFISIMFTIKYKLRWHTQVVQQRTLFWINKQFEDSALCILGPTRFLNLWYTVWCCTVRHFSNSASTYRWGSTSWNSLWFPVTEITTLDEDEFHW
jgi:hypothetical protein